MLLYIIVYAMLLAAPAMWLGFGAPGWQLALLIFASFAAGLLVAWIQFDVPGDLVLSALPFSVLVPTVGSTILAGLGPRLPRPSADARTPVVDRRA